MAAIAIGDVLAGKYRLHSVLGEGGFAMVYAATDPTGQPVAVKVFKPSTLDGPGLARLDREVSALRGLRNPHIVRLLDAGATPDGTRFLVFELIPGQDLSEVLEAAGGRLAPGTVVHILRQILAALAEAHDAGLVHRDIKPQNIRIFARDGDPVSAKLLDFGIARATDDGHPAVTRTGELIGTPRYMSPEQLTEQHLGPASDIYSLGLVAFELLLGSEALSGHSLGAQLERLATGHLIGVPEIDRVGPALFAVIQKMTARLPEDRYQSARAVIQALDFASGTGERFFSTAAPPVERRTRVPQPLYVILAVGCIGAVLAYGVLARRAPDTRPAPDTHRDPGALLRANNVRTAPAPSKPADAGLIDATPAPPPACARDAGKFARDFEGFVHVPVGYSNKAAWPALVVLHPALADPADFVREGAFVGAVEESGFVLIAPRHPSGSRPWDRSERGKERALDAIEQAREGLCVDADAVYVFGQAEGADVAWDLMCDDAVAGGISSGYLPTVNNDRCKVPHPRPFMLFLPTESEHAPFKGGTSCTGKPKMSAADVEQEWRKSNQCRGEAKRTEATEGECLAWSCAAPFRSCHLYGGRDWPGTTGNFRDILGCNGPTSRFPAARALGEFLRDAEAARIGGAPR